MTLTEAQQTEAPPARGRNWLWIGAAAVAATLVIGGAVVLWSDDTPNEVASLDELGVAEYAIEAFNDRDLAALEAVSTDELAFNSSVTVGDLPTEEFASLFAWLDAYDWRWENATCQVTSVEADVHCQLSEQNRLTDLTGAERPARVEFTMRDGRVESIDVYADAEGYLRDAFFPFRAWVRNNHPDDAALMWSTNGPILSDESADLLDKYLTEYADNVWST